MIEHPGDAIVRVTRSCICGSDLHLYHGLVPDTRVGHTFGHEFIGVVEEVGSAVQHLKVGDHVLVPFNIFCGSCFFCQKELYGNCHNTNPQASAVGAIYGYSHTAGGYDGGQAEYVRVPMADVGPTVIPPDLHPDDAVLLTDALPTGYQAAEMGDISEGDTVVVFGAGPVGIFAAKCAWLFGAGRVIVVDHVDYRLDFVRKYAQCEVVNFKDVNDMPVFVSPERPSITPLFGTSTPPSGISGMIRAAAFKTTENDIRHWLLLMLADRVNMVEGLVDDLSRGHVPNVLGEMGIKAEWKHNPAGLVKKAAIASAVVGAAWYLIRRPRER